ncbi:MAG: hypothetical protein F6J92_27935 [Symploca sp. SIO1A3]|nr:hypothetical protein [Symploca sp. SIO1A3]
MLCSTSGEISLDGTGLIGSTGLRGSTGAIGSIGLRGSTGAIGSIGSTGLIGSTGSIGGVTIPLLKLGRVVKFATGPSSAVRELVGVKGAGVLSKRWV